MKNTLIFFGIALLINLKAAAQNYHAINGSSYAGVLGVDNNPASILNSDRRFDINLLSFQVKYTTNAVTFVDYSLISSPASSKYRINGGDFPRYAKINFNMHLINARIALDKRQGIAFGVNLKSYTYAKTSKYNFSDTVKNLRQFLLMNEQNPVMSARLKSCTWLEYFATYSRTVWDGEAGRLHAGLTLKLNKGLAGAFANLQDAGAKRITQATRISYQLRNGSASYGYSANIDPWKNDRSTSSNLQDFFSNSSTGFSLDAGVEYLVKNEAVLNYYDEDNYYDYEWKIGASLLDVGKTSYSFGKNSRSLALLKASIFDSDLNNKFLSIKSRDEFTDSISTVFNSVQTYNGKFSIANPARLVLNVDRNFGSNFYLNGELSLNVSSVVGRENLYASELNLVALTPRWETRRWGAYLPMLYNMQRQCWIGGAVKAGPLLLGIHNLANIFSTNKMSKGGGYLALLIKPGKLIRARSDRRFECP